MYFYKTLKGPWSDFHSYSSSSMDFWSFPQPRCPGTTVKGAGIAVIYCYPLFLRDHLHITGMLSAPDQGGLDQGSRGPEPWCRLGGPLGPAGARTGRGGGSGLVPARAGLELGAGGLRVGSCSRVSVAVA